MIRAFQWTPTTETLRPVEVDRALGSSESGWTWIDIVDEAPDEVRKIAAALGLQSAHIQESINRTSFPLFEETPEYLYVVIHGFATGVGDRLRSAEMDLFIGRDFMLSVRNGSLPVIEGYIGRIETGAKVAFSTPASFMAAFALAGSRRYLPLIQALEKRIDELEDLAMDADPRVITEVHALRRDVVVLQRALGPQRDVFEEVAASTHDAISADAARSLQQVADTLDRTLSSLDTARYLLGSVVETHRGAVADQTNEIVRVLTVFSAILLPLSLIAGMWGMNFIDIPLADRQTGFWIMVGIMVLVGVALWLYFGRRGFVGAPTLAELPKAVGLGLVEIGTAPIRLVADGVEATVRTVAKGISGDDSDDETGGPGE